MRFNLQRKLLVLMLLVCLVALASAFVLRDLMIRDFKRHIAARDQERVFQVLTSLETALAQPRWLQRSAVTTELVRALQSGIETRLFDPEGNLLLDTDRALQKLPLLTKRRILIDTGYGYGARPKGPFTTYAVTFHNQEQGWLEARLLRPLEEQRFLQAANRFLIGSVLALGLLSLGLGAFFARRLANPLRQLTAAAEKIADGDLGQRVQIATADEIGRLAAAFNRMADSLEKHEKLRRQLVSNAAHELRTPLMVLRGELEGMQDGLLPTSPQSLQSLHQEATRLTAILDGVDDLTKAEASFLNLQREAVQLTALFDGIATRFGRLAEDKQARIVVACPAGLTVWADPDRLSQIVINLLTNALRALPEHGQVELRAAAAAKAVVIEVADNGHGIPAELLPHIFERFYKGKQGGLGLGLAIVRELVAAHNGTIDVVSQPGKGTTFTLHLPQPETRSAL